MHSVLFSLSSTLGLWDGILSIIWLILCGFFDAVCVDVSGGFCGGQNGLEVPCFRQ